MLIRHSVWPFLTASPSRIGTDSMRPVDWDDMVIVSASIRPVYANFRLSAQPAFHILMILVHHEQSLALLALALVAMCVVLLAGALAGLRQGLPLWSAAWLGSLVAISMEIVRPILQALPEAEQFTANYVEAALLLLAFIVLARQCNGLFALASAVAMLLQVRMFDTNAYLAVSQYAPIGYDRLSFLLPFLAATLAMALTICLATIGLMYKPSGYLILPLIACAVSFAPALLQYSWMGQRAVPIVSLFWDNILPTVVILVIPYLLGRRKTMTG